MPAVVLIAAIGPVGGVVLGLFGIGGGLLIVPALILPRRRPALAER